jgi:hypothetical protein
VFAPSLYSRAVASGAERRDEVAELRAWSRRAWWAGHRTPRSKVRALLELALTPVHTVRNILSAATEFGPLVARHYGVPAYRQVVDLCVARVRHGIEPLAYYRLQLFRPERARRAGRFVQSTDTGPLLRWLVEQTPDYPHVFGDKRAFHAWCAEHQLPSVPTLMEFDAGRVLWASGESLPPCDLFSKPSNLWGGSGARRWTYDEERGYVGDDGTARDAEALIAELARMSAELGRPVLLQRWLRNAAAVARLTTGALCTARIATVRPPDGHAQLLLALYRMPTGTAAVDNFGVGGLAAPVDLATGRLGRAIRKDFRLLPVPTERHPDTGATIEGHQLPHWEDAVSLVLRAHAAIDWKGVPVVGWDVALLEEGPVLLEGNNVPCSTGTQMITDISLGDTPFVACLNAHLRERFATPSAR